MHHPAYPPRTRRDAGASAGMFVAATMYCTIHKTSLALYDPLLTDSARSPFDRHALVEGMNSSITITMIIWSHRDCLCDEPHALGEYGGVAGQFKKIPLIAARYNHPSDHGVITFQIKHSRARPRVKDSTDALNTPPSIIKMPQPRPP